MKNLQASIITIGDELLIGQVIDSNSAFIGKELMEAGIWPAHKFTVGDQWNDIWQALDEAAAQDDIIIITGGLGPTADDITKPLLCKYFDGKMREDAATLAHVTYLFEVVFKRKMPLLESNRRQAEVPDVCTVLQNKIGTAPGMLFEKNGKYFFSLPGVPNEMQYLMLQEVIPFLKSKYKNRVISQRTLLTYGAGESFLAEEIKDFESALPPTIKLAYLPNYGMLRLRLTARDTTTQALDQQFEDLKLLVKKWMISDTDISMQELVAGILKNKKKTLATAESCTGGYIAHLLTAIPGASDFFKGSVVSYANEVKAGILQVPEATLESYGAVSAETVQAMVKGLLHLVQADFVLAVSGIMGPTGGTPEKPVGTVWLGVGDRKRIVTTCIHVRFDREKNIHLTAIQALNFLRQFILQQI